MKRTPIIALVGNPNAGKSSLFNQLTGLRQKVGNFPGVTVERKSGTLRLDSRTDTRLVDFPGLYSIYPKSLDEQVVMDVLANPQHEDYPDVVVVVADSSNLKRSLLLYTEVSDLGLPTVLALNMLDVAQQTNQRVNAVKLTMRLHAPVIRINARTGEGIELVKQAILEQLNQPMPSQKGCYFDPAAKNAALIAEVKETYQLPNDYLALQYVQQHDSFSFLDTPKRQQLDALIKKHDFEELDEQAEETISRYQAIDKIVKEVVTLKAPVDQPIWTKRLDKFLLHPIGGYLSFLLVLLLIFSLVFKLAEYPMAAIENAVGSLQTWLKETLPAGVLTDLLTDGLVVGIGGVVVFIPQIAFLFLLIALLEESGYMSRVMVIMDKIMRRFGLNGRSVVPLISGLACAVPAIMATRSISNRRERLLTILVTPLMSCSARLPVYIILVALFASDEPLFDLPILNIVTWSSLTMLGLYFLGTAGAILSAWLLKGTVKHVEKGYFVMEMPTYKLPRWNHVAFSIWEGVRSFMVDAGRVIVAISIVLWVLLSYGPGDEMARSEAVVKQSNPTLTGAAFDDAVASRKKEFSYAGRFGKFIEPAIKPLGYDWKIGIAILASFTAREVFTGTLMTIYSVGSTDEEDYTSIETRLKAERNPETGRPVYTPAVAGSLLIFYVFAMMCMSTLAVVYRETHSWKWPLLQFFYMTGLAYVLAFITYQLLK